MLKILKKKIFTKVLAVWVILLLIFNPFISTVALAEEAAITTGDAESQTDASVEANTNITNTPGTITPGSGCNPPDVTIDCQGTDSINNQNLTDTSSTNDSSAQTGQNSSSGSGGNVSIDTGEATAYGQTTNQLNTNIVAITDEPAGVGIGDTTPGDFSITNKNDALTYNEATVSADTGENLASDNLGNVVINSGDALAIANLFNLINTNIVGSNFEILLLNLINQQGDINLFRVWQELMEDTPQENLQLTGNVPQNLQNLTVENQNQAELNNNMAVSAVSGKNEANDNDGSVNLQSGQAQAVGNITNVVNTNLIGSKFLFAIINILGSYQGNLILPRREYFEVSQSSVQGGSSQMSNENEALVEGNVETLADSGSNELNGNSGDSNLQTGDAQAISHNFSLLNFNIQANNWLKILINHLGSRTGQVLGWSNPEAADSSNDTADFTIGTSAGTAELDGEGNGHQTQVDNLNQAKIKNQISVEAISGQNRANDNGQTNMITGGARALANLLNFANLNILGSNFFFGVINILGDWQGDTVFAYPDVAVTINGPAGDVKPGDEVIYNVSFENQGYDDAHGVAVFFQLPKGTSFVSDSSGIIPQINGGTIKWQVGDLLVSQSESFEVRLKVDPDLKPADLLSFWDKIIPTAYAVEEGRREQVIAQATVSTADPQSDSQNDSSSIATTILFPTMSSSIQNNQDSSSGTTTATTTVEISAKNNVNGFVYQGDIITFELEVKNSGSETAKNVTVTQDIYDGQPESTGSVEFPLGDISPSKTVKITFGIQVTELEPASYYSIARAFGDNISSNEAWTYFEIKSKGVSFIPEVRAEEESQDQTGDVAGIQACPTALKAKKEWWPYVLAAMFATLWFLEMSRRKQWDAVLINKLKRLKK